MKREELIAAHSTSLHELYLAGLGGSGAAMSPPMELALQANFGSAARWREAFIAVGDAFGGGSSWLLLTFQPREGTLVNQWCADQPHGLAEGVPILALDMGEHAGHKDCSAAVAADVKAFMHNIEWAGVHARYQAAVYAATESIGATADEASDAIVIDVRRAGVFDQASTMLPQARWLDPANVAQWAATMPKDRELVVYCVHGLEISRSTALRLRATGLNARYLQGGIEGWLATHRPVVAKPSPGDAP